MYPLPLFVSLSLSQLGKATGHFRANSKALAENEGDGIAKVS